MVLGAAVLAVTLAGMPADALAKKKRKRVVVAATIDGKSLKPSPSRLDISAGGGTIGLGILAQRVPRGGRGVVKTLYVACATLWPPQALGVPLPACTASYSEVNSRKPAAGKYWLQIVPDATNTQVFVDSWDGAKATGRFTSTIPAGPSSPGLPPVSLNGTFSGAVRLGDPRR